MFRRINDHCEANRVWLSLVNPRNTSRECSSCHTIDKKARNGEIYNCKHCGIVIDSDYNASLNILNRFLVGNLPLSIT